MRNYLLKELTMYVKEMKLLKDTVQHLLKIILLVLNTIALSEIEKNYDLKFNSLVADCKSYL